MTYLILLLGVTLSSSAFANVIFPAFAGVYVVQMFFPILVITALIIETIVFKLLNRRVKLAHTIGLVIGANLVSTIFGIIISVFLPSGLNTNSQMGAGPDFDTYFTLGFLVACVLSMIIEGAIYRLFKNRWRVGRPYVASAIGNALSYFAIFLLHFRFK